MSSADAKLKLAEITLFDSMASITNGVLLMLNSTPLPGPDYELTGHSIRSRGSHASHGTLFFQLKKLLWLQSSQVTQIINPNGFDGVLS